jgi:hypothetical protein
MRLPVIIFVATFGFMLLMIAEAYTLHRLTADLRSVDCAAEVVARTGH